MVFQKLRGNDIEDLFTIIIYKESYWRLGERKMLRKCVWGLLVSICFISLVVVDNASNSIQIESTGWLSGWLYRKAHNITGSTAGAQTNYQVMINVHYDNGADVESEVYLGGKCRTDFGDIRFTDSSGVNLLDYWIQEKVDGVQALFWVEITYIPESPNHTTIYIYYGNSNASTTSNKDWTFPLATDFEDGTTQGWSISWSTYVTWDDVSDSAFQGNYCRAAGRLYGSEQAGTGDFYEHFQNTVYLTSGMYRMEGAARFDSEDYYKVPKEIRFLANEIVVDNISDPGTSWHCLSGNFTLSTSGHIELEVEFHFWARSTLTYGSQNYFIDSMFVRKWCDPEPAHGTWGMEEISDDKTPPEIVSVEWIPTAPYPFVQASTPRQGEPVLVMANITEEESGSGISLVELSYRVNSGEWWNVSMTFNATISLWTAIIPGQLGNATVEFFIKAQDVAGNQRNSTLFTYNVKPLIVGDINGDGKVNMRDIGLVGRHFGETSP